MAELSRTGLLAAVRISIYNQNVRTWERINMTLENLVTTRPAPYVLRPFAGIYNPFPFRCSVLCNHPADIEAIKHQLASEKQWGSQLKSLEGARVPSEVHFVDSGFANNPFLIEKTDPWNRDDAFGRFADTDSKPASPAPTMASIETIKMSSRKRSSTAHQSKESKTLLVLDLRRRRSQSQETLSWREMVTPVPLLPAPEKRAPTCVPAPLHQQRPPASRAKSARPPDKGHRAAPTPPTRIEPPPPLIPPEVVLVPEEPTGGTPRRRGVKRRSRAKSRGLSPAKDFLHLEESGETQISKGGDLDLTRGAVAPETFSADHLADASGDPVLAPGSPSKIPEEQKAYKSFLSDHIIQHLQRGLDWQKIEVEFNMKRQIALIEAMRSPNLCDPGKANADAENAPDLWMNVPRSFSRTSARFELPMDSRRLNTMTPLEYAGELVHVSPSRKLLYFEIFNKHGEDSGMENESRTIQLQALRASLEDVMGQELNADLEESLFLSLGIDESKSRVKVDFRTFCGLCAISERVLGAKWGLFDPPDVDPKHLVEEADFRSLHKKVLNLKNQQSLIIKLLQDINNA